MGDSASVLGHCRLLLLLEDSIWEESAAITNIYYETAQSAHFIKL